MKKYGIETHEKDNTIGCRSHDVYEEWFDSQVEREKKFDQLCGTSQTYNNSIKDSLIQQEIASSPFIDGGEVTEIWYKKIEKYI